MRTSVVDSFSLMIKLSLYFVFLNIHSFRTSLTLYGSSSIHFEFLNDLYTAAHQLSCPPYLQLPFVCLAYRVDKSLVNKVEAIVYYLHNIEGSRKFDCWHICCYCNMQKEHLIHYRRMYFERYYTLNFNHLQMCNTYLSTYVWTM